MKNAVKSWVFSIRIWRFLFKQVFSHKCEINHPLRHCSSPPICQSLLEVIFLMHMECFWPCVHVCTYAYACVCTCNCVCLVFATCPYHPYFVCFAPYITLAGSGGRACLCTLRCLKAGLMAKSIRVSLENGKMYLWGKPWTSRILIAPLKQSSPCG